MRPKVQRCSKCGKEKPLDQFYNRKDGRGRKLSWCIPCVLDYRQDRDRQRQLELGIRTDVWDWAATICKHIKMYALRCLEPYDEGLDAEALRCLWQLQAGRCALTGLALVPPRTTTLKGTGIDEWRSALAPDDRAASVEAVRVDSQRPWTIGNIMLVAHAFAELYRCAGSVGKFREYCGMSSNTTTIIYDHDTITLKRSERCIARKQAAAANMEIPW